MFTKRYELLEKLGQGGMGIVYEAHDRLIGQSVALKQVLVPEEELETTNTDTDSSRVGLAQEFHTLASLRHPYIVSVLDFGFDDKQHPFYTMELLKNAQPITKYSHGKQTSDLYQLLAQILEAVSYLHRRGILHRDIKPDNAVVTGDGQLKLMDFGLALSQRKSMMQVEVRMGGTLPYMAPELFLDQDATIQSDLYAIGVIAYEILLGQHPFGNHPTVGIVHSIMTDLPDTSALNGDMAEWLDMLLAKQPNERPRSADEALLHLQQIVNVPLNTEPQAVRESVLQASTFVGRDAELTQLRTDLQDTLDGSAEFTLIGGESGVGKSRLVEELRIRALVQGALVLRGQSIAEGGTPFYLWRSVLRHLILLNDIDDLQASILKDLIPDIEALLQRSIPTAPHIGKTAYQQRLMLTITELVQNTKRAIVLILEDLQWADEGLLPLRQLLNKRDELSHLYIVGTYRSDEYPTLPEKLTGARHIRLQRLSDTDIADLSASLLGEIGKQPEIVELLQKETEGNTYFIIEAVRALAEDAGFLHEIGRVTLPQQIFTGGMKQVIQRRIQNISADDQKLLKLAAIAGRLIDTAVLSHAQSSMDIQAWLYRCENAAVLHVYENQWRFAHDKLREALLAELAPEEISTLHRAVAEALEAVYANDEEQAEVLLEHWHQARDIDKEIQYLQLVADYMVYISGDYQRAMELIERGLNLIESDDPRRTNLLIYLARAYWRHGDDKLGQKTIDEALSLAQQLDDLPAQMRSLHLFGTLMHSQDRHDEAQNYYQQSLALARQLDDKWGEGLTLNNLAVQASERKDFETARRYFGKSLAINRAVGNQRMVSLGLNNLGVMATYDKDTTQAIEYFQQSLALSKSIGNRWGTANTLINMSFVLLEDAIPKALKTLREGLKIAFNIDATSLMLEALVGIARVKFAQEDYAESATIIGMIDAHPAADIDVRKRSNPLLADLRAQMTPETLTQALERGKYLSLKSIIKQSMAEITPT